MSRQPTFETSISNRQVGSEDVVFIRSTNFNFTAINCKPNTRLYPFFDSIAVDEHIQPANGRRGDPIITDNMGSVSGTMNIPGGVFRSGQTQFMLNERIDGGANVIEGMNTGFAVAFFSTQGVRQLMQRTITNTMTVFVEPPPQIIQVEREGGAAGGGGGGFSDPIAQQFSTFGIEGGCFLHSVELFFREKGVLPLRVEIRKMVNGYPSIEMVTRNSVKSLTPDQVNVSLNASIPTIFRFDDLIYLEPDQEYCFVVLTNDKNYFMYVSELGKTSIENGRIVFEQTHLGSMFRSQNNHTWTPVQFEDVKFKLNICEFDTSRQGIVTLAGEAEKYAIDPAKFRTTAGSNIVTLRTPFKHALDLNSRAYFQFDPDGVYNGIPGNNLNGSVIPTRIIDDFTFAFAASSPATSTGPMTTGGFVHQVFVNSGGMNYNPIDTTVVFTGGGGSGATGEPIIKNGKIIGVRILNKGTGYTSDPQISVVTNSGSGAILRATTFAYVVFQTNNLAHRIEPAWHQFRPGDTKITSKLKTHLASYPGSGLSNYTFGRDVEFVFNDKTELNQNVLIASKLNNDSVLNGEPSTKIEMILSSTNKNISPRFDAYRFNALFEEHIVNNQFDENPNATESGGRVLAGVVVFPGAGYTGSTVTATVQSVDGYGSGAAVNVSVTGAGGIDSIIVTNPGSGYRTPPRVVITGQNPTQEAVIVLNLSEFNTELAPENGRAVARYITRPQRLLELGRGARIIVNCYSSINTDVDVYFKGSQASSNEPHDNSPWVLMNCPIERNKSRTPNDFFDYTFTLDSFPGGYDVFQYKIVLKSKIPFEVPIINNIRAVSML